MLQNSNTMLKQSFALKLISAFSILIGVTSGNAQAATITSLSGLPEPSTGISYEWLVQINRDDSATLTRYVGAKSWNEPANPPGLKGWTHTSNWVALEFLQPAQLTIKIDRQANVATATGIAGNSLYPAFSLFSGWDNEGEEEHQFNTLGNTSWADGISYLSHEANESAASSVFRSFVLPAGLYSLVIGSNPPDLTLTGLHGYTATLSTTPIPEPSTDGLLSAVVGVMLLSYLYRYKSRIG